MNFSILSKTILKSGPKHLLLISLASNRRRKKLLGGLAANQELNDHFYFAGAIKLRAPHGIIQAMTRK